MGKACEGFQQKKKPEGPKGMSTRLGAASRGCFSITEEGYTFFYLEGSKGWPVFH